MGKTIEELKRELAELEAGKVEKQETRTDGLDAKDVAKARAVFEYLKSGVIERRRKEEAEGENEKYQVCQDCFRKQAKGNQTCELCGIRPDKWMEPAFTGELEPANVATYARRARFISAATVYSAEKLNWYIEYSSSDIDFIKHCARVLELKGVPRVMSFWERSGFTLEGKTKESSDPSRAAREVTFNTDVNSPAFRQ